VSRRPSMEPLDVEEQIREARERLGTVGRLWPFVIAAGVLLWLASGIYMVQPAEVAVIRTFGQETGRSGPGLYYRLPAPIQLVDTVNVEQIRRAEIGFRTQDGKMVRVPAEALMLTRDENIVDAQLIVQYRVKDPSQYLFRLRDPQEALAASTEVALRSAVGRAPIDEILTTGRSQVQGMTRIFLQALLDTYESGLQVTDVKLQVADPPEQVKDAFQEVVRAREDRERLMNEARAYREDILPKARGQAQETLRGAEAYKEQRTLEAQGDVSRFVAVLREYKKSKDVTRDRLHLEAIERILSRSNNIVLDGQGASGVMPFLPLRDGAAIPPQAAAAQAATQSAPRPAPAQPSASTVPLAPSKPGVSATPAAQSRR